MCYLTHTRRSVSVSKKIEKLSLRLKHRRHIYLSHKEQRFCFNCSSPFILFTACYFPDMSKETSWRRLLALFVLCVEPKTVPGKIKKPTCGSVAIERETRTPLHGTWRQSEGKSLSFRLTQSFCKVLTSNSGHCAAAMTASLTAISSTQETSHRQSRKRLHFRGVINVNTSFCFRSINIHT